MSRVIKFRTFLNGMMSKPFSFGEAVLFPDGSASVGRGFKLMQFTGLHDANGVEIWENDVVYVPGLGNAAVEICPHYGVVFCNNGYRQPYSDGAAEGDYPTVLGSIYEHPHLLDGGK